MGEGTVAARVELLRVLPASSLEEHTGPHLPASLAAKDFSYSSCLRSDPFYALSPKVS